MKRAAWQIWRDRRGYLSVLRAAALALLLMPLVKAVVVLETIFDFDVGVRPGWQVLAAGLAVAAVDAIRARWSRRPAGRRAVAAE